MIPFIHFHKNAKNYIITSLILVIILLRFQSKAQTLNKNYTTNDGLGTDYIECISQDSCGFVWVGTKNGLNRFDGISFSEGQIKDFNSELLFKNRIYSLFLDSKKNFWAGTDGNGLVKYNYKKNIFETIALFSDKNIELDKKVIKCICEDKDGSIWIATPYSIGKLNSSSTKIKWFTPRSVSASKKTLYINALYIAKRGDIWVGLRNNGGLYRLNNQSQKLEKVIIRTNQLNKLEEWNILSIEQLNDSIVLLGTEGTGLLRLNIQNHKATQYIHSENNQHSISNNEVWGIFVDSQKKIYTATLNGGLDIFEHNEFHHQKLQSSINNKKSISAIFEDSWGNLWIGTHNNGIYVLRNTTPGIKTFSESTNQNMNLNNNQVSAFYIDKAHKIWIGTDGGGLICYDQQTGLWKKYGIKEGLQSNVILSITELPDNTLWMATWGAGIAIFNKTTQHFTHLTKEMPNSVSHDNIKNILFDGSYIWIATHGDGINLYDWKQKQFVQKKPSKYTAFDFKKPMWGNQVLKDSKGNIWIGTTTGLFMFNGKVLSTFYMNKDKQGTIPSNYISCIYEDKKGTIWFGTNEGLCNYDFKKKQFIKTKHRILDESIKAIVEDSKMNLWITTSDGFVKFNYSKDKLELFTDLDNLIPPPYTERALYKDTKGNILAGGTNMYILFNPDSIHSKTNIPILLTSLEIANVTIDPNKKNDLLHKQIFLEDTLIINYNQNVFGFHFHALTPLCEKSLYYSYRLEGFDAKWQSINFQTSATYTNLPPGSYTFIVKACNKQGFTISQTKKLLIIVLPPWWKTLWFKFLIILILLGLIVSIFYLRLQAITSRNRYLEKTVSERTAELIEMNDILNQEQQKVIDQNEKLKENQLIISIKNEELIETVSTKDKLISIIGHDVKNPLGAVLGFLTLMPNTIESGNKDKLKLFHKAILESVTEIQKLFDNLLEWSLGQSGNISYTPQEINIDSLMKDVLSLTKASYNKKYITINYNCSVNKKALADPRMVSTVLRNLVQNSIKFTHENGTITITITETLNSITCQIADNGIGMKESHIIDVLRNKSTFSSYGTHNEKGTGLGLQTCKAFIEKNKGEFTITSKVDEGTTITFTLPIGIETNKTEDNTQKTKNTIDIYDTSIEDQNEILLFIDDNDSILEYLKQVFSPHYTVITANDGVIGLEKAKEFLPDLIVSDIMMPRLNGLELCIKIKADILTQHIPIILLTAENTTRQQISGLLTGAEDYITKPLESEVLFSKVKTILLNREIIRNHLKQQFNAQNSDILDKNDDVFIQEFKEIFLANLATYNVTNEFIAEKMGCSRSQIYRKCLAITGQSPHDYIKVLKVQLACQRLLNSNFTISEIAYDLGFTDPKYFSTIFTKEMNMTPKHFRNKNGLDFKG